MDELSEQAKAMIRRYRATESLRKAEHGRLLQSLTDRAMRGDAPLADVDIGPPSAAPPPHLVPGVFAKVGIGAGVVALAAIVLVASHRSSDAPSGGVATSTRLAVVEPAQRQPEPIHNTPPIAPNDSPSYASKSETAVHAPVINPPKRKAIADSVQTAAPELRESTIDEEMRLLRDAQSALRAGSPARSLALLDEHATRFPAGKLSDARDVTRMLALCNAGQRALARSEAERFLSRRPDSPFTERVRHICTSK
jgi:hypothetical protein